MTGAVLYRHECAPCHGPTGHGDGPQAVYFAPRPRDLHSGFLARYRREVLIDRVRRGRRLMIDIDDEAIRAQGEMVEQIVAHLQRLPDLHWDRIELGATIYAERCELCHGPFGRPAPGIPLPPGVAKTPRDLSSPAFQKSINDAELAEVARHGRKAMPAIPPLASEDETKALVSYLRVFSPGFELYSLWCGGCHGDDGRGEGVFATSIDRPNVVFDQAYLKAQDGEALRRKVTHMFASQDSPMPHFARDLSEAQVGAIIEYLETTDEAAPAAKGNDGASSTAPTPAPR